jgi:hypothetical protein
MVAFGYSSNAVQEARTARARAAATRQTCRRLVFRCRAARGTASLSGSSDSNAPLVCAAITAVALCDSCIAMETGVPPTQVAALVSQIARTLRITIELGRCERCMRADLVSRLR